ncbi:Protein JOKA2 [Linum perenne]
MESTMVIKVRYGDTLRRFNAVVKEDGRLAIDLEGLRAKVLGLFNFPPDAEVNLTYVDEDGDVVTLVEDYDLQDVMRQNLKFLRVDVTLKNAKDGSSLAASSGCSTPSRSPAVQSDVASGVADALKTLPPQLYEAVSKFSRDVASKAAASGSQTRTDVASGVADVLKTLPPQLYEAVLKVSNDLASKAAGSSSQTSTGVPDVLKSVQQPLSDALSKLSLELASKTGSSSPVITDLAENLAKMGLSYIRSNQPAQVAGNARPTNVPTAPRQEDLVKSSSAPGTKSGGPGPSKPATTPVDLNQDPSSDPSPFLRGSSGKFAQSMVNMEATEAGKGTKEPSAGIRVPAADTTQPWANTCPFSGMAMASRLRMQAPPPPHMKPFKRCHSRRSDGMVGLFHRGVQCDGCGIHPIAGPRYKSKVKENYDLCSVCFAEMGDEADYVKMDKPMSYRHSRSLRGLNHPVCYIFTDMLVHQVAQVGSFRPKLDSRFISDVNVVDGTIVAPATPFTKIWRLRNNGGLVWPQGTQLVWIGGDKFSHTDLVELEIPENGLPLEAELDVAIDFTSPILPGRYISYWRAASPSGTRFGQRIWVLIQVDASLKDGSAGTSEAFNLNFPPPDVASKRPESADLNGKAVLNGGFVEPPFGSTSSSQGVMPVMDQQEKNFPVNDTLLVGKNASARSSPTISYPIIDFSDAAPPSAAEISLPATNAVNVQPTEPEVMETDANDVEKTLLKELEEMGFKQINLNKEILKKNEYNLEQSLDDLCGVGEWDPILEELEEMGFNDKEMNKKLLQKNNGSIKRVVMDLLTGEKA